MTTLLDLRKPACVTVGALKEAIANIPDGNRIRLTIAEFTAPALCVGLSGNDELVIGDNLEQGLIREQKIVAPSR